VGSSNHILLNFSIFLLTVGISFLIGILTVHIDSIRTFTVFVIFTVIGFIGGLILLLLWGKGRKDISKLIRKIKSRIPSAEVTKADS
jgi:hypothetical protein